MWRFIGWLSLFAVCAIGCASSTKSSDTNGYYHREPVNLADLVRDRAATDLDCPKSKLKLKDVTPKNARDYGLSATQTQSFLVKGCGKKVTYSAWCTQSLGVFGACDAMAGSYQS